MVKYTFSGHDSFQCRHLWPKKGYDYIKSGKSFNDEDAVIILGVGKNMVSAIRYWMKALNLLDNNECPTNFAEKLLCDNGWDPYLEDEASLWLLHYHLVKKGVASTYSLIFNELRKEKIEFTKENFIGFLKRKSEKFGSFQINEKTITDDFNVFVKMYDQRGDHLKDKEDTLSGLFVELGLISSSGKRGEEKYIINNAEREAIPYQILLYSIIENGGFENSISLSSIEQENDFAGSVFCINRIGLTAKIEEIVSNYKSVTYSDHAGIKEIQFKTSFEPLSILEQYYAN